MSDRLTEKSPRAKETANPSKQRVCGTFFVQNYFCAAKILSGNYITLEHTNAEGIAMHGEAGASLYAFSVFPFYYIYTRKACLYFCGESPVFNEKNLEKLKTSQKPTEFATCVTVISEF